MAASPELAPTRWRTCLLVATLLSLNCISYSNSHITSGYREFPPNTTQELGSKVHVRNLIPKEILDTLISLIIKNKTLVDADGIKKSVSESTNFYTKEDRRRKQVDSTASRDTVGSVPQYVSYPSSFYSQSSSGNFLSAGSLNISRSSRSLDGADGLGSSKSFVNSRSPRSAGSVESSNINRSPVRSSSSDSSSRSKRDLTATPSWPVRLLQMLFNIPDDINLLTVSNVPDGVNLRTVSNLADDLKLLTVSISPE